ncbi:hypothetical protein L3X38_012993 [Prunus dulcis]|uniref:TIR domain-containing protein n=1 Tax=Prunus dulcis TaxID=3755 RepID=A0AAD4WL45_PRUDU|nr:hypothetical protein L3X38_012993 [Prunus dulcis]
MALVRAQDASSSGNFPFRYEVFLSFRDYASSKWCLDDLVLILERKRISGHVVLPVFYDVDPSEVRKQTGSLEKAFAGHQKNQSLNCENVKVKESHIGKLENLARLIRSWVTPPIPNWFWGGTSTSLMVPERREAFWELTGFGVVRTPKLSELEAGVIPGWVIPWEVAPPLRHSDLGEAFWELTGFGFVGTPKLSELEAGAIPG